jgi:hypothetical protein
LQGAGSSLKVSPHSGTCVTPTTGFVFWQTWCALGVEHRFVALPERPVTQPSVEVKSTRIRRQEVMEVRPTGLSG